MKKIYLLLTLLLFLYSCSNEKWNNVVNNNIKWENKIQCRKAFSFWSIDKNNLHLKWVVISDEIKNITSPIPGIISYLDCNPGNKVNKNTIIAKITPDFNNPNISNLVIQKNSLINQKNNIASLKQNTIFNFNNQISDIKGQITILKKNIELSKKSSLLNKQDLNKQISWLKDTIDSLNKNLDLLKKSKQDSLNKINISKKTLLTNIKNTLGDNLIQIDTVFWITSDYLHKNDTFEAYLSVKKTSLINEIKTNFYLVNNKTKDLSKLDDNEISLLLWNFIKLDELAQDAMNNSVANIRLPQTKIDWLYKTFLNYTKSITTLKSSWDSIENSIKTTNTNYDTQITSLENQINSSNTTLKNLQTNKIWSIDTWLELQLSTLDSQLKTLQTNLNNLEINKKNQILNLDNQLIQLEQSIKSINSNLSVKTIYSNVDWVINKRNISRWNTIAPWISICQILPVKKSLKIKIYSPIKLNLWDKLFFYINKNKYDIFIKNSLIYKDQLTQNYIYESNYLNNLDIKNWDILDLSYESKDKKEYKQTDIKNKIISVPISYIINKINWNFIKVMTNSWVLEKEVKLWDINWKNIEIISWLNWINTICK